MYVFNVVSRSGDCEFYYAIKYNYDDRVISYDDRVIRLASTHFRCTNYIQGPLLCALCSMHTPKLSTKTKKTFCFSKTRLNLRSTAIKFFESKAAMKLCN